MAKVGLPQALLERRSAHVSGGEPQWLGVVRAMLMEPALVFADEATSRLDLLTQEHTMDCPLTELIASGCALLLVTHDKGLAGTVAHRQLQLRADAAPARATVAAPTSR